MTMCPGCQHPSQSHGAGGWCLFPDCECGKSQALTFQFWVAQDGISWLVHAECVELQVRFHFTVKGETENEAVWNADRILRKARLKRLDG